MTDILVTDFIIVLLIFLRIISAFMAAPIFNSKGIPVIAKIFLAFFVSVLIFLSIDTSSIHIEFTIYYLAVTALKEIITGLVIGFMLNLIFYGITFAGSFIGFDMGLFMSQALNPFDDTNSNTVGEILYFGALLVFFIINGHHYIIQGLGYSFTIVPIGKYTMNSSVQTLIIKYSAEVFILAVKISSPIIVSFFLVAIAEGVTSRIIPQMQVFFVTQPLKLGLGFAMLAIGAPIYIYFIKNLLELYESNLLSLIKAME